MILRRARDCFSGTVTQQTSGLSRRNVTGDSKCKSSIMLWVTRPGLRNQGRRRVSRAGEWTKKTKIGRHPVLMRARKSPHSRPIKSLQRLFVVLSQSKQELERSLEGRSKRVYKPKFSESQARTRQKGFPELEGRCCRKLNETNICCILLFLSG